MNGMRRALAPTSPARRPPARRNPVPPVAASAGMSRMKPQGIAGLTATTVASDANNSEMTVESQKVAIVSSATAPATGWMTLAMVFLLPYGMLMSTWVDAHVIVDTMM